MSKCVLRFQTDEIAGTSHTVPNNRIVRLYGTARGIKGAGYIGNVLLDRVKRLGVPTSKQAFDILTISMAVTAADTFFKREEFSDNNWARDFELHVPVVQHEVWSKVGHQLEQILHFLTGDRWCLNFLPDGPNKPNVEGSRLKKILDLNKVDSVCLYSGGLDSWLGVKQLIKEAKYPALVSHSYPKDSSRQKLLYKGFNQKLQWFEANASPFQFGGGNDTSMRSRSFNFLAMGAVVADAAGKLNDIEKIPLYIPENGFIALNAPLTPRRLGTHSTRTAHPNYLTKMQQLFDEVGIRAQITNPFNAMTKGEMLVQAKLSGIEQMEASETVSCGKWKRKTQQCGRCVPCLIRRASFHKASIKDESSYADDDIAKNYSEIDGKKRDDLMAVLRAVKPTTSNLLHRRALKSGPLPSTEQDRKEWLSVHERGLVELTNYLSAEGLKCD